MICRLLALGQDPLQAVSGARLHHQLLPDLVRAEHWNVSSVTGPSFRVTQAEVEVYLPTQLPCCAPPLPEGRASVAFFSSQSVINLLFGTFYKIRTALGAMMQ